MYLREKGLIMNFQLRHDRSDTFICFIKIESLEDLKQHFFDNEITINFDEQIIWVKSKNDSYQWED
jgi:hypothetical protein